MTASDQGDGTKNNEAGVFRSLRPNRVVVTSEEPQAAPIAKAAPAAALDAPSDYASLLASTYAATFDGGEAELWQFYETLAEARVHVLLDDSTDEAKYEPKVFSLKDSSYLLAFEQPEQADELTGTTSATSPVQGMDLFKLLRGRNIGLGINMGGTSSATLIAGETVDMICAFYDGTSGEDLVSDTDPSQFRALLAPKNFPDTVQNALGEKLSGLRKTFSKAVLLQAEYEDGQSGYIVAISGATDADRGALATTVEGVLAASRRPDIKVDVAFLAIDEPMTDRIERIGLILKTS